MTESVHGFPPTSEALEDPNGLLAVGGDLSPERLIAAYRCGIFPWYQSPQPILWWTPNPRAVLYPSELHVSRSLRKRLRQNKFSLRLDSCFLAVIRHCGQSREDGPGTWISEDMLAAYTRLHDMGIAHSIEVFVGDELVGGLYGLALGRVFFGESMFSYKTDASKVALVALVDIARRGQLAFIDCQVENDHLKSMGARTISRLAFEHQLAQNVEVEPKPGLWQLPASCGALL